MPQHDPHTLLAALDGPLYSGLGRERFKTVARATHLLLRRLYPALPYAAVLAGFSKAAGFGSWQAASALLDRRPAELRLPALARAIVAASVVRLEVREVMGALVALPEVRAGAAWPT